MAVSSRRAAFLPPVREFTPLPQSVPGAGVFWKRQGALRSVLWNGAALLQAEGGDALRIDTLRTADGVEPAIMNLGLALLLSERGHQILHAGGLARNGAFAAILGPPGAGKSTLVLAGARRGMQVISDEIVPFRMRGRSFVCPGANPVVRVDACLSPRIRQERTRSHPAPARGEKVAIDVRRFGWCCAEGPSRLGLLVFLGRRLGRSAPRFRLEKLPPAEALVGLLDNTFNRRVLTAAETRRHLRLCAAVVKRLSAYRLRVRRGVSNVAAAARGVDQLLARRRVT